jgi:S1-C subfamily serine protease
MKISDCVHKCDEEIEAHTVRHSDLYDLSLVVSNAVMKEDGPESRLASSEPPVGDPIYIVGAPGAHKYNISKGIISSYFKDEAGMKYYRTDAAVYFGNSGGPAFNTDARVIGIVVALEGMRVGPYLSGVVPGSGIIVPADTVYKFVYGKNMH